MALPGLQEWIHNLEEGKGALWIKRIFVVLALAGLAAFYDVREYKNFSNPEAMDSAQVARQIAAGRGFSTKFLRPLSIKLVMTRNGEDPKLLERPHPDLANAPVFPLLQAALMKVLPFKFEISESANFWRFQPEMLIAIFNQVVFGLLLLSLYLLGRRLFDEGVARTTVAVTALSEIFWRFSVSGLPTILLTLITVWIIACITLMEKRSREQTATNAWFYPMAIFVGALLALGTLTRYSFGWMLLPIIVYAALFFGARRGGSIAVIVLVTALGVAPWCFRNYQICGRPFGIAEFAAVEGTLFFQHDRLQRSMPQNIRAELNKVGLNQFGKKLASGVDEVVRNEIPKLGGSWVTALFLVGLLAPFRNPGLSRLRYFLLGSLLFLIAVQSLGKTQISEVSPEINSENLLLLICPLIFMFGIALFYSFIDQIPFELARYRAVVISAFVGVVSLPLLITFLPPRTYPFTFPPYYPPSVKVISGFLKPEELMMSDMPWAVAWYGDRTCVWTTLDTGLVTPSDFFAIHDHIKPVKLLYLTPLSLDVKFVSEMLKEREAAWSRFALDCMVRTNVPPGFPLKHSPRGYLPDFLVLTDRKRW